ncbi:HAD family hydrolase [Wenjunlia tyrosinilytica]|uniref:HAD family hydrolase n=1 Tax=Wenjunlia tyrosinilytica TaxID=1544741 RepID=UPI00166D4DC3|nr:HAD family hydrolase [Wenjunlia tyrosinilytica]
MNLALFDLDGTLVDRQAAFTGAVADLCRAYSFGPEVETWMLTELADRANAADFVRLREAFALTEPAAQLWQAYVDQVAAAVSCRPAVLNGLARLRESGWTIGIVTNGASDIQRAKLTATGLADLVDGVAVSGDIEVRKPDPQLFQLAAARCHTVLSRDVWMTGDNPACDIGGGHQVGLRTIWLRGRPWPDGVQAPHHAVDDVTDAFAVLLNDRPE